MKQNGQTIAIVGSSSGLGRSIARVALRARGGHHVLLCGRDVAGMHGVRACLPVSEQWRCRVMEMEARKGDDWERFKVVASVFTDRVDHLVYCAGVSDGPVAFDETSRETRETVVHTNLLGAMCALEAARESSAGHVYGVTGHGSNGWATPEFAAYGASKAALKQLFLTVGEEWKKQNDDTKRPGVHLIAPGFMRTPMTLPILHRRSDGWRERMATKMLDAIARDPENVARSIVPQILGMKDGESGRVVRP